MNPDVVLACPSCATIAYPQDRFCEACGAALRTTDPDPENRDDACVVDCGAVAGVSHRGHLHHRNEDALFIEVVEGVGAVAVVCDGVSTSFLPDFAAAVAAQSAGASLVRALRDGGDPGAATIAAMAHAQTAVTDLGDSADGDLGAPACTFVSAVHVGGELTIGWVGDSRTYWIGDDDALLLTADNSWLREQIDAKLLEPEEAKQHPRAHAITRWLGADAPDGPEQIAVIRPRGHGRAVVCSDGLWNYAPDADELARWVRRHPRTAPARVLAQALTDEALTAGGHDNVTVVVIDVGETPEVVA